MTNLSISEDCNLAHATLTEYPVEKLSLEEQFLLFAVRKGIRGELLIEEDLLGLSEALDWSLVVQIAFENRVASLLSFTLSGVSRSHLIPQRESGILKKFYLETAQKNMRIKHSLKRILEVLGSMGIDVIVLKGAALAYSVWPSMATRQMHDIDIVVPIERVREAIGAIMDLGYRRKGTYSIDWHLEHTKEFDSLLDPVNGVVVEVHYRFFTPNPMLKIDERPFWDNSELIDFDGVAARVLGSEELMVLLCLHVSVGHFLRDNMRSLLDILLLTETRRASLDPKKLRSYFEDPHVGPLIAFPVLVCARYLGVDFTKVFEHATDALSVHYSGLKLRILEKAAERFLLKIEAHGVREWAHVRLSKKVIYEPKVGLLGLLSCFFLSQPTISRHHGVQSSFGKFKNTVSRRIALLGSLIGMEARENNNT